MNQLEDLLAATLAERAADAPDGRAVMAALATGERRRHRSRWLLPAAAAVVMLAVLGATVVGTRAARDHPRSVGASLPLATDVIPPPAGAQWVSVGGVQFTVPDDWRVSDYLCPYSLSAQVEIVPQFPPVCTGRQPTPARHPQIEVAPVAHVPGDARPLSVPGGEVEINPSGPVTDIYAADNGIHIRMWSTGDLGRQVLSSLRISDVDPNGCSLGNSVAAGRDSTPPRQPIVPAKPRSVSICRYTPLLSLSRNDRDGERWRSQLINSTKPAPRFSCARADSRSFALVFHYEGGRTATVQLFGHDCNATMNVEGHDYGVSDALIDSVAAQFS